MSTTRLAPLAFAALVLVALTGRLSRADLVVTLSESGYAPCPVDLGLNPGSSTMFVPVYGDFEDIIISASSSALNPLESDLSTTEISLTNSGTISHTLIVTTNAASFTTPVGNPLELGSSMSLSDLSSGASLSFTSYVNLPGPPVGPMTASPTLSFNGSGVAGQHGTAAMTIAAQPNATFELDQVMSVTLAADQSVAATGSTSVSVASVPEPSRTAGFLGLASTMLLGLVWKTCRPGLRE